MQRIPLDVDRSRGGDVHRVLDGADAHDPWPAQVFLAGGERVAAQINADLLRQRGGLQREGDRVAGKN